MVKSILTQTQWSSVAEELAGEDLKLASYDSTLLKIVGEVTGARILDYGCGPGVLVSALSREGADVWAYDISPDMQELAAQKIGKNKVHSQVHEIPHSMYDTVICNLVMCIVNENEVGAISEKIRETLKDDSSRAYIGFCNPHLWSVPETQLDLRPEPKCAYQENHSYLKTKKEGGYQIVENHRPLEWYETVFRQVGLKVVATHFTPEYELKGRTIKDFVIFELAKGGKEQ